MGFLLLKQLFSTGTPLVEAKKEFGKQFYERPTSEVGGDLKKFVVVFGLAWCANKDIFFEFSFIKLSSFIRAIILWRPLGCDE